MTPPRSWFPVIAKSLEEALFEGRISKIRSPRPHEIVLTVRATGEKRHLLLSAHPKLPRAHLVSSPEPAAAPASDFAMVLRKHVQGARIDSVLAVPFDRIIEIGLRSGPKANRLVVECVPGKANIFLVDPEGKILGVLRRKRERNRILGPGQAYRLPSPPPPAEEGKPEPSLPGAENLHAWLEETSRQEEAAHVRERYAASIGRRLRRLIRKERKRRMNLQQDLVNAGNPETWRRRGELLKIHAGRVEKGTSVVDVPDVFEPDAPVLSIPLDPRLDLEGNMEAYFKRYRKAREGRKKLRVLIEEAEAHVREREKMVARLAAAVEEGDDASIWALGEAIGVELPDLEGARPAKRPKPAPSLPYRRFVSLDGHPIWVGRNDEENDRLTAREARGGDLWLHVDGVGGSHVLVRLPREQTAPRETLLDAANLAAFFSQARGRRVDVTYTPAKHVRKPKKARSGLVMLSRRSTLRIEPDGARLERLLGKPPTFR